jgi:hypothetical protein
MSATGKVVRPVWGRSATFDDRSARGQFQTVVRTFQFAGKQRLTRPDYGIPHLRGYLEINEAAK